MIRQVSKSARIRRGAAICAAMALTVLTAACGTNGTSAQNPSSAEPQTLTVFAAASLEPTFRQLADDFQKQHPGVTVSLSTAGSSDLVSQIAGGAPADVLATADEKNMNKAVGQKLITGKPTPFASNVMEIAVAPGNPHRVSGLNDLTSPNLAVVRCAVPVPCGNVAQSILDATKITLHPKSEENSVTDVLGKVTSGQADAGLVYATDIRRSKGKAEGVAIAEAKQFATTYPIAVTTSAKHQKLAKDFIALVTSPEGQKVLQNAGFARP
ncbi:molybdate ABC transporter substrate-binding protein [Devriesea agamarum]|uniref:molybdate ABC transporter substrate-binding protein n=1 Tax=Devriesea agamarum TaxID=472569 RepID=UPI00071E1F0C|nr:molybdate ABC transporter substrate-binding protein [Devriesea agamarum]